MSWQIQNVRPEDIIQLKNLEEQCFSIPWTREQLESQLPDEHHCFILAKEGDRVLGYVGMMYVLDEGYISNVAVAPEMRQKGIGDSLIEELMHRARERDLSFVTLEVRESNMAAISLYKKHGFQTVEQRKKYYDLPKEDAILMTKYLK